MEKIQLHMIIICTKISVSEAHGTGLQQTLT